MLQGVFEPPYLTRHFVYVARIRADQTGRERAVNRRRQIDRSQKKTKQRKPRLVGLPSQQGETSAQCNLMAGETTSNCTPATYPLNDRIVLLLAITVSFKP